MAPMGVIRCYHPLALAILRQVCHEASQLVQLLTDATVATHTEPGMIYKNIWSYA